MNKTPPPKKTVPRLKDRDMGPIIENYLANAKPPKRLVVEGATVVCTQMVEPESMSKMIKTDDSRGIMIHERQMLTLLQYYIGIGIPSKRSGGQGLFDIYYTRPWEIIADYLGGVDRTHSQEDINLGWAYMRFLQSLNTREMLEFMDWTLNFDVHDPDFSFLHSLLKYVGSLKSIYERFFIDGGDSCE